MRKFKKYELTVIDVRGHCIYGYEKGQVISFAGLKTPSGFCGASYHGLFPNLFALNFNGKFGTGGRLLQETEFACPDGGNVVFKLRVSGEIEAESIRDI